MIVLCVMCPPFQIDISLKYMAAKIGQHCAAFATQLQDSFDRPLLPSLPMVQHGKLFGEGSCLRSPVQMSIRIKLGRRFKSPAFGGKRFGSRHQLKRGWVKIWRRVISFRNTESSVSISPWDFRPVWWSVTNVMLIVTNASPPRMYSQLGVVCRQLLPTGPPEVQHWCCHWAEAQNWSWDKAQISKLGLCPRFERIQQNNWHTFERIYSIL